MTRTHVAVLSVVVSDMPRALTFYRACGLDIDPARDGVPHAETVLDGGFRLMFDTVDVIRSFDASWTPPVGGHRTALAIDCGVPAEVDRRHAELVGAGATDHVPPFDAFWGQRYAVVLDPDGNPVDLFAAAS